MLIPTSRIAFDVLLLIKLEEGMTNLHGIGKHLPSGYGGAVLVELWGHV